ncbi:MAG: hypothetical protein ABEI52_08245, partial [Halobacteriaceae archaeon]
IVRHRSHLAENESDSGPGVNGRWKFGIRAFSRCVSVGSEIVAWWSLTCWLAHLASINYRYATPLYLDQFAR